jgi:ABC-type glycerol-3-phosphate transport system substrate-binding protein
MIYKQSIYGIWAWTDVRGIWYWKDLLNKAGVDPTHCMHGMDISICKKIKFCSSS